MAQTSLLSKHKNCMTCWKHTLGIKCMLFSSPTFVWNIFPPKKYLDKVHSQCEQECKYAIFTATIFVVTLTKNWNGSANFSIIPQYQISQKCWDGYHIQFLGICTYWACHTRPLQHIWVVWWSEGMLQQSRKKEEKCDLEPGTSFA